jgi:hypothetical protein
VSGERWYWTEHKVVSEDDDLHSTLVETPSNPPTELTVLVHASVLDRASVIDDAKLEILHKLAEGSLSVTGIQRGRRVRQEIAILEWCDLSIDYDKKSAVDRISRNEIYEHLMFRREAVLKLWPDVLAVGEEQLSPGAKKLRRGRTRELFWTEARAVAMAWLIDEGCPAPGDGNQARLERHVADWLSERDHNSSEPTIRRHVAEWIAERRDELERNQ